MFVLSDPLIVVHHIFCMSSLIVAGFLRNLGGLGFIVTGTQVLEVGTVFYNWSTVLSNYPNLRRTYWTIMSITNIIASVLAIQYWNTKFPLPARLWYVITVLGLSIGRQREVVLDWQKAQEEGKKQL
jgi:hypothetical protein